MAAVQSVPIETFQASGDITITGSTATLNNSIQLDSDKYLSLNGSITTLNLAGNTITGSSSVSAIAFFGSANTNFRINGSGTITGASGNFPTILIEGGNVTLNNVTVEYTGSNTTESFGAVQAGDPTGQISPVNLTVVGGSTITATQEIGIAVFAKDQNTPTTVNINDCAINSASFAVTTNGNPAQGTGSITINVGQNNTNPTLTGSTGMYLPDADATVNIYSGTITGDSGICIRGGTLNVNGGTITGNSSFGAT